MADLKVIKVTGRHLLYYNSTFPLMFLKKAEDMWATPSSLQEDGRVAKLLYM